ncbi:hypothetical protein WMF26_13030 [Sorangium sp. So ce185]|uniref:hypothetical protein n=1 Tax=Sorangium sp. So ce185 TaxID=3133287 RepID=UPI003F62EEEF
MTARALLACALLSSPPRAARAEQGSAAQGPEAARRLLDEAYARKAAHDTRGAAAALEAARAAGADAQLVALELGYLASQQGDREEARRRFEEAGRGPDEALARKAQAELRLLPQRLSADLYAETYGWSRVLGAAQQSDLVPTLRARGFFRPSFSLDLGLYAYAQVTRDLASRGRGAGGVPLVYADNYALAGLGAMLRLWDRRIGLFVQAGPALNLLDDGRERVAFDARGGAFFGAETGGCAPGGEGVSWTFVPCAELYAEAVFVSRFDDNVIAFARPRLSATYLVTGPLAWQVVAEGRAAADTNSDFFNNFVDAGAGPRLRLLRPLRLDLALGLHAGSYLGREGRDPAPRQLGYVDLRLQAATYVEF